MNLGFDAKINENVDGHILFIYEEGATPFDVDEATITVRPGAIPLSVTAGKMYVPFGNFTSNMISYSQTLEIAETNETALQVGFEAQGFSGSVYTYNGVTRTSGGDNIEHYGANVGYAMEMDNMKLDVGAAYISSIGDSPKIFPDVDDQLLDSFVAGYSAYAIFEMAPFSVIAEYVAAADSFKADERAFKGDGAQPAAYNIEFAYGFDLAGKETTVAVAYQGTQEAFALERPESVYLGCLAMTVYENTRLAVEYAQHNDYGTSDGGTDDSASIVTVQLAVEF
jgi:hypothetical protein